MGNDDLKRNPPFDLHLQWFGDPPPDPASAAAAEGGESGEGDPAGSGEPGPLSVAPWLSQASDKYKKSETFLQDLLRGPKAVKSWTEVLDRMFAGEQQAAEHQAAFTDLQAKLTAEQARAAELEKGGQPATYKPEDYLKIKPPKLPNEMATEFPEYSEELSVYLGDAAKEIATVAQELGISPAAAQRLADVFAARHVAAFAAGQREYSRQREAGLKSLKETWKGDFAAKEDVARRAILAFGGPDLVKHLALRGLENDAVVLYTFHRIGAAIGEGQLVPGRAGPTPGAAPGMSDREAAAAASQKKRYPSMSQGGI